MKHTCKRCGKTMEILQDGDGIHTCSPKYPWPMDRPIEEIGNYLSQVIVIGGVITIDELNYLIDRLKIAEAGLDELEQAYYD